MAKQLDTLDATAQAQLVKSGEITSLELVEAAIARIEEREPKVNALCASDFEIARNRAEGALTGAFAGVPFLAKDLIRYPGLRYSLGSRPFAQGVPALVSAYSKRLDDAGLQRPLHRGWYRWRTPAMVAVTTRSDDGANCRALAWGR